MYAFQACDLAAELIVRSLTKIAGLERAHEAWARKVVMKGLSLCRIGAATAEHLIIDIVP
jgi:hypothetical protein